MDIYKNTMTGEAGSKTYWEQWANRFYAALCYDEAGRSTDVIKQIENLKPSDWWERTQKVLKLEIVK